MKAAATNEYGAPEVVKLVELPDPKVGPDSVLVRVKAAGVNPVDWKVLAGYLDGIMRVHFPLVPGWDVAGVVERVGSSVTELAPGDEVMGYVREDHIGGGTFAEKVAAPLRTLARKPKALDWNQAAALPLVGLTAYQALRIVEVAAGETVLVHAAAGGVGSMAVQIARAKGARVIGTASEASHAHVKALGGEPVAYGEGLEERVRALAPDGVDAVLDLVGNVAELSLKLLKGGEKNARRLVSIAESSVKERGARYWFVRPNADDLAALAALADAGKLTVNVSDVFPLERAGEALEKSKSGKPRGKIVVTIP
jgi:NADPH:quinone reductase-like Zn-dependent oxidoreductase